MDNDSEIAKLNTLVGAAIKGLVDSGAAPEAIGAFAQSYRQQAAQVLGLQAEAPPVNELQDLIKQAVTEALAGVGVQGRTKAIAKKFYVTVKGHRTSVTIRSQTANSLLKHTNGDVEKAKKVIEDLANSCPKKTENRSRWIDERILTTIAFAAESNEAQNARH